MLTPSFFHSSIIPPYRIFPRQFTPSPSSRFKMAQPKPRPVMVVIVGMTGAGKTTFASIASGKDLKVGDGNDPCTQDPQAVFFKLDGRTVALIDTPGFDDTTRSDVEILAGLGRWLVNQDFAKNHRLDGLILLHPITEQRVDSGTERKRTRLIQNILGKDAFKRVIIATTMWDCIDKKFHGEVARFMGQRSKESGLWADLCNGGATIIDHQNSKESAHSIIRTIIKRSDESQEAETLLQSELASKSGHFTETSAGQEVRRQLDETIELIMDQLLEHRSHRPPYSWRKSQVTEQRRKWKEWDEEKRNLMRDLELRQGQLKKLDSFVVSTIQQSSGSSLPHISHASATNFIPTSSGW